VSAEAGVRGSHRRLAWTTAAGRSASLSGTTGVRVIGIHPHDAGTATEDDPRRVVRDLLAQSEGRRSGQTRARLVSRYAPRDDQRRLFAAELELAVELRGSPS